MSQRSNRVALQLPIMFCPTAGCGYQLTGQLYVDLATDVTVCLFCARERVRCGQGAHLAPLKAEDAALVPGCAPALSEEDAIRFLLALGATVLEGA